MDHFTENEEIFNKIIETFLTFENNTGDIEHYKTISLINDVTYGDTIGKRENSYIFFTAKSKITDGKNNTVTEKN